MLVTAEGEWVLEDSAEFLAALNDPNPDYDSTSFAVKNLGFIKFQILDNSIIEIDLHPQNVELPALLTVQQQLLSSRIQLFRIKYLDLSWRSEILDRRLARRTAAPLAAVALPAEIGVVDLDPSRQAPCGVPLHHRLPSRQHRRQ
jgi:hypothetical protein